MSIPIEKLVIIEKITQKIQNRYEAVRVMAREDCLSKRRHRTPPTPPLIRESL